VMVDRASACAERDEPAAIRTAAVERSAFIVGGS
jgi:hypothetical protein